MQVEVTKIAEEDLEELPDEVEDTLRSKIRSTQKNLNIGASPGQAFDKYLGGNMNPCLQMNLGRDYRAWFVEGQYLDQLEDDTVYCVAVLSKNEAKKMIDKIPDFLIFLESALQQ